MRRIGVPGTKALAAAAAFAAVLALAAGPASAQTLRERLDGALSVFPRAKTGAFAYDLHSRRTVYRLHSRRAFEPASNQKLSVAVAVLDRLGPWYRITTSVRGVGSRSGSVWQGRLHLKGHGDPSLSRGDLRGLARAIRNRGIRRVSGRIMADESYFDRRRTGPGWDPSWYRVESPPLSALVVARGQVDGRTVARPWRAAAVAFRKALRSVGVAVPRGVGVGKAPATSHALARTRSAPLTRLVRTMNKVSDNFYAEMLLKHLGRKIRGAGTTYAGAVVVRNNLDRRGVPLRGVRIADGSGLSPYNRLTARAIGVLLISAWRDASIRAPLVDSLPIAGVDGTLADRMRTGAARGRVRAKTGTTFAASALSGYVGRRYVFSILQNGRPINYTRARRSQNRFAQVLARAL
jgi:D-alanyl-D-alanine carboxypeptidase/D-alanyl-D-alanine-endopeptidase (penicillin-binding protein 4)